jgi:hypothetical protein
MADYNATARSNYFQVKDPDVLSRELDGLDIVVLTDDAQDPRRVVLLCRGDHGCWPSWRFDEEGDDDVEVDLPAIIAKHLTDGQVAVLMESGAEELRFIGGVAVAVNNRGEQVCVSLDDIYERAKHLGEHLDRI